MKKLYSIFGIILPVFYVLAVLIGGALIKGYSHTYNAISEITASNLNVPAFIQILFAIYNLCLILFAIGLYLYFNTSYKVNNKIASIMLVIVGLLGIGMYFFPQDPRHIDITLGGKIHIILAGLAAFLSMLLIIIAGAGFKGSRTLKGLRVYSYMTSVFLFISGGITSISLSHDFSLGGLSERITIGLFIQWVFVIALTIFKNRRLENMELNKDKIINI